MQIVALKVNVQRIKMINERSRYKVKNSSKYGEMIIIIKGETAPTFIHFTKK